MRVCGTETHYRIRRLAGVFVLASLALGYWVSPWFFLFTAFVGLNLLQSSFTKWCPVERVFESGGSGPPGALTRPDQA
jgi:hypothetical protein